MRLAWWRSPYAAAAVLAVPFLVAIAASHGLTDTLHTFHWTDERRYHLPAILKFAHELPAVQLSHYGVPITPLFHLLFAVAGKVVGFELWKLRLLDALISYAAVLVLYRLLRRVTPLTQLQALVMSLVFGLSPYFFGASFILLTDNLAWLFGLLALDRLVAFDRGGSLRTFALACAWGALAVLTRQSYLWLFLMAAIMVIRHRPSPARAARAAGLIALALAPYAALVITWHGFAPPGTDVASCGLCTENRIPLRPLRPVAYVLALVGLYGAVVFLPLMVRSGRAWIRRELLLRCAVAAIPGIVLLAVQPMRAATKDDGFLWRLAENGPTLGGTSWLFWSLVPLGCAAIAGAVLRLGASALPVLFIAALAVSNLGTSVAYQKYFDPFVLLGVFLAVRPSDLSTWHDAVGILALGIGFVAYAVTFPT